MVIHDNGEMVFYPMVFWAIRAWLYAGTRLADGLIIGAFTWVLALGVFAPLAGVAYASQAFDCDTATYETPDVLSTTTAGSQNDYVIAKDWALSGSDGQKKANLCLKDAAGNVTGASTETSPLVTLELIPIRSSTMK